MSLKPILAYSQLDVLLKLIYLIIINSNPSSDGNLGIEYFFILSLLLDHCAWFSLSLRVV